MCIIYCSSKYNLNALSHDSAIGLIRKLLEDGVKVKEVSILIDNCLAISVDPVSWVYIYKYYLTNFFYGAYINLYHDAPPYDLAKPLRVLVGYAIFLDQSHTVHDNLKMRAYFLVFSRKS